MSMTKKIMTFAVAVITALSPMTSVVRADSGAWSATQASAAWSYDGYRVEKLSFGSDAIGPLSLGDYVIVAEPADASGRYNVTVFKDGMSLEIANVPSEAIDEERYFENGERFIYADASDLEENYWNIVEVDLETGEEIILVPDIFIDGVEDISLLADGNQYYLNTSLNFNNHNGYTNAIISVYDPKTGKAEVVTNHWIAERDEMQDVQDGVVLSKIVFDSGYKQLWTYDLNEDPIRAEAVADTWTPANEDIVGAHFRDDGTIEYFRMYQRYVSNGDTTAAQNDFLSWYRDASDVMQIMNGRLAWLDSQDVLRVSDENGAKNFGVIGYPNTFRLEEGRVFYATGIAGAVYDFATGKTVSLPFAVSDSSGNEVVGTDALGSVWHMNLETENTLKLGIGTDVVLSDESHAYWQGVDGGIYEATILPAAATSFEDVDAVKVAGNSAVYLIRNNKAYGMANEKIYFSWFDSWNDVKTVTQAEFSDYDLAGTAAYAPGTKMKLAGDPKVYVVGEGGELHWITTQTVAYNIYGETWNRDIVDITLQDLTGLTFGDQILTERDIENI